MKGVQMKFNEGDIILINQHLYTVDHTSDLGVSLKGLGWIGIYTETYENAIKYNGVNHWYRVIKSESDSEMFIEGRILFNYDTFPISRFENLFRKGYIENWKPKPNELCFFWNEGQLNNNGSPHFSKYGVSSYTEEFYENIEPYIGPPHVFILK